MKKDDAPANDAAGASSSRRGARAPAVRSARTAGESGECAGEATADHARNTDGRPMSADCHCAASIRQPADYGPLQSTQYRPRNIACAAHLRQFVMGQLSRRPMPEHRRCRDQYIGFLKWISCAIVRSPSIRKASIKELAEQRRTHGGNCIGEVRRGAHGKALQQSMNTEEQQKGQK
ncbi:hypothetical protein LGN13_12500 [Burkholderia multivorans]|uniref:hypothetical protein n=1 Tax=Burkholderia multivorans TaxID=87883 RepID=UPI0014836C52|nr:hypothetical protein [Burkholderia multivorans]MCA8502519.1 hypothetical protein [Burkholderia multivorans]MDN8079292.1 hypothetical protein [Burkholderia multivorans]